MAKLRAKTKRATARKTKRAAKPAPSRKPSRAPGRRAIELALAGVAHDIRTPLTGIMALAELLAASDLHPREREWAQAIKSSADHLAALTTLIVDAAKADAAGLTLRREPFSPRALADAVAAGLAARAGNKQVAAEIDIAVDLPPQVAGDAMRLRAALENLADNAVKFTTSGRVAFSANAVPASRGRLRLVFTVADSGIGMSARELRALFRPFAQANEEVARRFGGAGLGLAFVKRVAKAMGGDLTVVSREGDGSSFRLTVLVERIDRPALPRVREIAGGVVPRVLAILCVEDNPFGRVVMHTILRELGHRADFADTGASAVDAAARGGYDAVLMDVTLPDFDGLEATRRIRALPGEAGRVPVIGISGRDDAAHETAARAAGMNGYFVKPVGPKRLNEMLLGLLSSDSAR